MHEITHLHFAMAMFWDSFLRACLQVIGVSVGNASVNSLSIYKIKSILLLTFDQWFPNWG